MRNRKYYEGVLSMTQRNYYEAMIKELDTKIYEQEIVLKNMQDPLHMIEVRYRLAQLAMERQTYRQILKNMLVNWMIEQSVKFK